MLSGGKNLAPIEPSYWRGAISLTGLSDLCGEGVPVGAATTDLEGTELRPASESRLGATKALVSGTT